MTQLLAKQRGHILGPQLYYRVFVGNFMCPVTFGQNDQQNCGEGTKMQTFLANWNEKKIRGCNAQRERACAAGTTLSNRQGRVSSGSNIVLYHIKYCNGINYCVDLAPPDMNNTPLVGLSQGRYCGASTAIRTHAGNHIH